MPMASLMLEQLMALQNAVPLNAASGLLPQVCKNFINPAELTTSRQNDQSNGSTLPCPFCQTEFSTMEWQTHILGHILQNTDANSGFRQNSEIGDAKDSDDCRTEIC